MIITPQIKKLSYLTHILEQRLPHIKRWNKVQVEADIETFTITWSEPKVATNTHPFESKEMPLTDLDEIIDRNKTRLRNETKTYK